MTDTIRAPRPGAASASVSAGTLVGRSPGQPEIGVGGVGAKRVIVASESVLPELDENEAKPRPLWKRPAFLVSIGLTAAALIAAGVFLVLALLGDGPPRVTSIELTVGEGNAHLVWGGTDEAVDVYVVNGGEPSDLSQLVRGGSEIWLPVGIGEFDDDSCFVVRPRAAATGDVSLDAAVLDEQGARSACVAASR